MEKQKTVRVNDDRFGAILNCAVRYSIGRETYMPSLVVGYITPLLPYLNDKTIYVFDQDVTDKAYYGGYGNESIDKPVWMKFLGDVRAEEAKRGMTPYKDWRATHENQN